MSTRSILIATGILAIASVGACKSKYSDVYSFKKNSFEAPVKKRDDIQAPPTVDPLQGQTAPGMPGAPTDVPGIPGIPGAPADPGAAPAPTGIPGLDPAPAPAPATPPAN